MSNLKSSKMTLSAQERSWLPWFGANNKLSMKMACGINRQHYRLVEYVFDSLATSRKKILIDWALGVWDVLEGLSQETAENFATTNSEWLRTKLGLVPAFSELMLVDLSGQIVASSIPARSGYDHPQRQALEQGLQGQFLHGPYADDDTVSAGATTSAFHDEVTLMFYHPVTANGSVVGCLCARVPNDVMSDLIQRESGHVYKNSGDNYLFMAESRFDKAIKPGTALSRSRFEDDSVIPGPNLKSGVRTPFSTVRVSKYTELELMLTDPSTGNLHPGVRETIRHGSNLFVTYPGYSDYRYVPVIGKGLTFQMPGSVDTWGIMCEADLAEVYCRRSLSWRYAMICIPAGLMPVAVTSYFTASSALALMSAVTGAFILTYVALVRPTSEHLEAMLAYLVATAEGGRLDDSLATSNWSNDVVRELGLWNSNMTGKVLETVNSMKSLSLGTDANCASIIDATNSVLNGADEQSRRAESMSTAVEELTTGIGAISENSQSTSRTSTKAADSAAVGRQLMSNCNDEIRRMNAIILETAEKMEKLNDRSKSIGTIIETISSVAEQTNLLALNAAIEAARAGEQGRGFAVVADEVRSLAARTALSTNEIKSMIEGMQDEVGHAVIEIRECSSSAARVVSIAQEVDTSLNDINNSIQDVRNMVGDIASSTEQQGHASNEISSNLAKLATTAEKNHKALSQTAISVHGMRAIGGLMDRLATRFQASRG